MTMNNLSVIMYMKHIVSSKNCIASPFFYFKYLRQRDRLSVPHRPPRLQEVSVNQLLQFVPRLCLQHHWTVCFSKVTALAGTRDGLGYCDMPVCLIVRSPDQSLCVLVVLSVSSSMLCCLSVGEWVDFSATHLLGQYVEHSDVCTCLSVSPCQFVSSAAIKIYIVVEFTNFTCH